MSDLQSELEKAIVAFDEHVKANITEYMFLSIQELEAAFFEHCGLKRRVALAAAKNVELLGLLGVVNMMLQSLSSDCSKAIKDTSEEFFQLLDLCVLRGYTQSVYFMFASLLAAEDKDSNSVRLKAMQLYERNKRCKNELKRNPVALSFQLFTEIKLGI